MKKLTKQDILEGTRKRITLFVKEYNAEIVIRPLTDGEISKIFSLVAPAASVDGAVTAVQDETSNLEERTELQKNFEALRLATSMGMEDPKLTLEEVSKMKFGVPEEIGSHVLKISGVVMSNDEIKKKGKKYKNS
jgi:hypothetical protein